MKSGYIRDVDTGDCCTNLFLDRDVVEDLLIGYHVHNSVACFHFDDRKFASAEQSRCRIDDLLRKTGLFDWQPLLIDYEKRYVLLRRIDLNLLFSLLFFEASPYKVEHDQDYQQYHHDDS